MKTQRTILLVAIIISLVDSISAQVLGERRPPPQVGLCGKVSITDFSFTANTSSGQPAVGQSVPIKLTIQNCTNQQLSNVPFTIERNGQQWTFSFANLPPGGSQTFMVSWIAEEGEHRFVAKLDPWEQLGEAITERFDNSKSFTITPFVPAGRTILTGAVTIDLDFNKAMAAGGLFSDEQAANSLSSCSRLGVENAQTSPNYGIGQPGVVFVADCSSANILGLNLSTGGSADPEAYKGFRLKNGWRVHSITLRFSTNKEDPTDWHNTLEEAQSASERRNQTQGFQLTSPPAVGTNEPVMKAHIAVKPGGYLKVYVRVVIVGISGTDPYGDSLSCRDGFVPVITSNGTVCASAADVTRCSTQTSPIDNILGSCSSNTDCVTGYVCSRVPCNGRCVRAQELRDRSKQ
jgi:hypothetical protein